MKTKLIADENVNYGIIKELRSLGYDVVSVLEDYKGASDEDIITKALEKRRTIITHDNDFGSLAFRGGYEHCGVILLRLKDHGTDNVLKVLLRIIGEYEPILTGSFIVGTDDKVRIRRSTVAEK